MDFVSQYKGQVDLALEKFFTAKMRGKTGIEKEAVSKLREFTMRGGKRIRPLFMILGYWLGSDIDGKIVDASVSLELMQSYLLIHDDIIDQSEVRRGGPTFHRMFGYDERVNEGVSIVCADLSDAYSHEALLEIGFTSDRLNRAMKLMSEIVEQTGVGQLMDITLSLGDDITPDDVTAIHKYKTAQYTVNGPMKMGAILGGYSSPETIDDYGIPLGIAFQIQDDILGMFGNEKELGKSVVSDFEEGKKTHLVLYTYEMAEKTEVRFIKERLGKKAISNDDFQRVKEIVENCGALERARSLSEKYYDQAISTIDKLTDSAPQRDQLKIMADLMVKRVR
ncbi:MAG: polyprenyl synthetase family protein [Candidatus Thermoplasmatota archaeon]|nr:polyprenyl synthetase family protein [Candidatus Thermoplasmatota archaeon]